MAKEKVSKKEKEKVSKPGKAEELGPEAFTDQQDYEEQVAVEANPEPEEKVEEKPEEPEEKTE